MIKIKPMAILAPSLLSADFLNLEKDVQFINHSEADWFHVDVMDGRFVPNISFGFPIMNAVARAATKPLDVHLMIVEPEKYVEEFAKSGAYSISVHIEACPNLHRNIQQIKALGVKAGVAVNPHTPVSLLEDILGDIDFVNLMSVNPGFGGQKFIPQTIEKIKKVKAMLQQINSQALIEIDGGVTLDNAAEILAAGADILVAGSSVFNAPDPTVAIQQFKKCSVLKHT